VPLPNRSDLSITAGSDSDRGLKGAAASSSARLGAARIEGLAVPQTASASPKAANTAMVARAEVASSRNPAARPPSGAISSEMVLRTDSTRPSSRSGVIVIR
jgi:hypothetical protein